MNVAKAMTEVLRVSENILSNDDMSLVFNLLSHDEAGIAVEFICDKLAEYNSVLSENLGFNLQFISTKLKLDPIKTWEGLIVENIDSHQLRRIFRDGPDLNSFIRSIFHDVIEQLQTESVRRVSEYLEHDELDLAIDSLSYGLINGKIEISKSVLDKIRIALLDLGRDPEEWKGFLVKAE